MHMFRDTFSIHLLDAGMGPGSVATLLRQSSTKTTEKYYKSHTRITQDRISAELRQAWKSIEKRKDCPAWGVIRAAEGGRSDVMSDVSWKVGDWPEYKGAAYRIAAMDAFGFCLLKNSE